MRLSEYQNEDALDLLADLLDPATEIFADPVIKEKFYSNDRKALIKTILKDHKAAIVQILARLEDTPVEDFKFNLFSLTKKLLDLMNDPELMAFFTGQGQMEQENPSGSAMVNTADGSE